MEERVKTRFLLAAAFCVLIGVACSQPNQRPPDTGSADRATTAQLVEREDRAFANKDVDGVLAVYSADVVMMPPNEPAIRGKDALRPWFTKLFSQQAFQASSGTSEGLEVAGDLDVERITLRNSAGQATGKVIHVYRRQADGTWQITQDIWNTDAPAPGPK